MRKNSRMIQYKKNTAYVDADGYVHAQDPSLKRLVKMRFSGRGHPRPPVVSGATLDIKMAEDDPLMKPPEKRRRRWRR